MPMKTATTRLTALLWLAMAGTSPLLAQPQNPDARQPATPPAASPQTATPSDGASGAERTQRMDSPGKGAASSKATPDVVNDTSLVLACKQKALAALKRQSPSVEDIFIDMDGLTVAQAESMIGNTKVIGVMMGEAYIQRDKSDKVHRFLCLTGEEGKVLMTFFTER